MATSFILMPNKHQIGKLKGKLKSITWSGEQFVVVGVAVLGSIQPLCHE